MHPLSTELTDQQLVFSQTALMHACTEQCLLTRDRHQTFLCKEGLHLSDGLLVTIMFIIFLMRGRRGTGAGDQEKRGKEVTGGGRRGNGKRDSQGGGKREKKGKIMHHCTIFCNRKNAKRQKPTNTGREPGLKSTGSLGFRPPCPPLPPGLRSSSVKLNTCFKTVNILSNS